MLPGEALEVLGLGPGATAAEIKEAYRDLVKVWHPDRFGSDLRLRRKAEEKLQQINNAYHALQSRPEPARVYSSGSKPRETSRRSVRPREVWHNAGTRSKRDGFVWTVAGFGVAVAVVAAAIAFHRSQATTQPPVVPDAQRQEPMSGGSHADASPQTEPPVSPSKTNHSNHEESPPFRVRQLSDAEAAQLESACRREKEMQDPTKYQDCVRAQLGGSEPDMSSLSAEDLRGIQSACKKTRSNEGLAAYNRCLTRMVKLLRESSRP